ncbi:MAG: MFS transporter [Gammaproteobacteria bacterium]|nr:MFS transporter [Gammaproteobacteria bacterium]
MNSPDRQQRSLAEQVYGYLAEDEDARVCRDIPESACHEQPRAFTFQLLALSLTKLGDALVSARLVLAWMLASLAAPAFFIGLLVPIRESLALLPQLFIAQAMRERPLRKFFWVTGSVGQALALSGMAIAALSLRGAMLGWSIIGLLVVFSLARGVCSVAAKDVLGKTVSKSRRGRLSGSAASFAGLASLLVALIIVLVPREQGDPWLFAGLLAFAAGMWLLAAVAYAAIPEVPGATEGGGNAVTEALASLGVLRRDPHFRHFVIARALLVASAFAIPYLVVLLQRQGDGQLLDLGYLLLASGLSGMVSGNVWGRWSDDSSEGVMTVAAMLSSLVIGVTLLISAFLPALLDEALVGASLVFLATLAHHGARVGRKTYLVDMASSENRAQYTAVSNTVMGVILLLGMSLGVIDQWLGIDAVLLLLLGVGLAAAWTSWRLPDVSA